MTDLGKIQNLLTRLQVFKQDQEEDLKTSGKVNKSMLKRVHKLLSEGEELGEEESEEERSDFELLEKVHGKARYAEIQKALEDSYVEDPTLEQFTQARHELLSTTSGSSLSPVSQLRIIAVKHKNDLDEGWDNKNYGRLASELNDKVGRGKYPDVRSLNSLRK